MAPPLWRTNNEERADNTTIGWKSESVVDHTRLNCRARRHAHSKISAHARSAAYAFAEAFRVGAKAYVFKGEFFELLAAIDAVRQGHRFVSSSLSGKHIAQD